MTPRATRAKYSCMSSTHIHSFAERLNRAGCTGPHIGALTIVRQHLLCDLHWTAPGQKRSVAKSAKSGRAMPLTQSECL